jgi:uncharacterized membrane protein YvbJ
MNEQQYCKYCGASVDSDSVYCSHCGKNITSLASSAVAADIEIETPSIADSAAVGAPTKLNQKINSPGAVAIILLCIVALFFTLLALYFAAVGEIYGVLPLGWIWAMTALLQA